MEQTILTSDERRILLALARRAIEQAVCQGGRYTPPDLSLLPPRLRDDGVCFVTLTEANGDLRGCIGGLEATQPLALDVCQHAAAAALEDWRFYPVTQSELPNLRIEISRLTHPEPLPYNDPAELLKTLRPGRDGVILRDGDRRATFLPQVWDKIPDPGAFLSQLCQKMGAPAGLWQHKILQIEIYCVEEIHEN